MKLVRVVAPHFVAGFETDGIVRRAAPIIHYMLNWPDNKAREYIKRRGWHASICEVWPRPSNDWGLTTDEWWQAFNRLNRDRE
jgi:hypothetical protein